jgi:hypothetical protein
MPKIFIWVGPQSISHPSASNAGQQENSIPNLSRVLATLTFQITSPDGLFGTKQANNKRKGVGRRDATGELHSVLRRKTEGRAAVTIIRVIDGETDPNAPLVKYLVQMKSHTIPSLNFAEPYVY